MSLRGLCCVHFGSLITNVASFAQAKVSSLCLGWDPMLLKLEALLLSPMSSGLRVVILDDIIYISQYGANA